MLPFEADGGRFGFSVTAFNAYDRREWLFEYCRKAVNLF